MIDADALTCSVTTDTSIIPYKYTTSTSTSGRNYVTGTSHSYTVNPYPYDFHCKDELKKNCKYHMEGDTRVEFGGKIALRLFETIINLTPKKVHFNPPVTVVIWEDGTKTIVRVAKDHDDEYDAEQGLAMAYMKKIFGSRSAFQKTVKKFGGYEAEQERREQNGKSGD